MTSVLEEMTADTLSRAQVERRLEDWAERIDSLFAQVVSWVTPDWAAISPGRAVQLDGEPMREVGLGPKTLPVLDLRHRTKPVASFVPRGLWIIGANGRIDVLRQGEGPPPYFLVDEADNFEPPRWRLVTTKDRTARTQLEKSTLLSIL